MVCEGRLCAYMTSEGIFSSTLFILGNRRKFHAQYQLPLCIRTIVIALLHPYLLVCRDLICSQMLSGLHINFAINNKNCWANGIVLHFYQLKGRSLKFMFNTLHEHHKLQFGVNFRKKSTWSSLNEVILNRSAYSILYNVINRKFFICESDWLCDWWV